MKRIYNEDGTSYTVPESPAEIREWWLENCDPQATVDWEGKTAAFFEGYVTGCDLHLLDIDPSYEDLEQAFQTKPTSAD